MARISPAASELYGLKALPKLCCRGSELAVGTFKPPSSSHVSFSSSCWSIHDRDNFGIGKRMSHRRYCTLKEGIQESIESNDRLPPGNDMDLEKEFHHALSRTPVPALFDSPMDDPTHSDPSASHRDKNAELNDTSCSMPKDAESWTTLPDVAGSVTKEKLSFEDKKAVVMTTEQIIDNQSKYVKASWEALARWSRTWRMSANRGDDALVKTTKIAVLGGGSFGTAMAVMLARNKLEMDVCLLVRNEDICDSVNNEKLNRKAFPNKKLPINVRATTDPREALNGAQYCIHAVPVQASAQFLRSIAEFVPPTLPILSVSKGLEIGSLEMMSQLIPRALGNPRQPVAVLSGPSFSIELMDELPTAIVAASKDKQLARAAQQLLASKYLRVNTSTDVVGVEMAGALKNVLAIAAGIVEGMNLGNNCMAALVAQGCAEIRWLAEKMGANPATLSGLAGTGDIMLTCFVNLSRNRTVGVRLGAGEKLEDILSSMSQVAEGVATASAVIAMGRKYRVQMPVLTAVARILQNELTPKQAVMELMSLPQVEER